VILLDTNVLSAVMQRQPDPVVVAWLDSQAPESVWTTAVTVFEIRFGIELLRPSRRRNALEAAFDAMLRDDLGGRIAMFDSAAAEEAAKLAVRRQRRGRSTCAIPKSPVSRSRGEQPWRPVTFVTSRG
jgi:predicted nucleic acid-binding protein